MTQATYPAAARKHEQAGVKEQSTTSGTVLLCGPPLSALGGGPTHLRNMLASPLNRRFRLIHFETGSRGTESPSREEKRGATLLRLVVSPWSLALRIARSRPAVVHINSAMNNRAFWRDMIYVLVSKLLGRRVVFQLHGGRLSRVCTSKWLEPVVRSLLSIPDAVVALAQVERIEFEEFGVKENLVVIPNAIDVSPYRENGGRIHGGHIRRLAFLGRVFREKGVLEAIEAVDILRKRPEFAAIEFHIAGAGAAIKDIEHLVRDRGLHSHVKLIGPVFGSEKVRFLREADVFVFPSYHTEGLPYVILESLAAGTPVVASTVAGIPDVVRDGVHGLLIEACNPEQIAAAVQELAQAPQTLRAMSKECTEWASGQFGLDRLASQFEELYEKVRG